MQHSSGHFGSPQTGRSPGVEKTIDVIFEKCVANLRLLSSHALNSCLCEHVYHQTATLSDQFYVFLLYSQKRKICVACDGHKMRLNVEDARSKIKF